LKERYESKPKLDEDAILAAAKQFVSRKKKKQ
jgi:hypothetical protein